VIEEPMTILVVEDDSAHAEAVSRGIRAGLPGAVVNRAGNLRQYHAMVKAEPPDFVLMDLNLPDGLALESLTFPPEDGAFPVIIMTAFGNESLAVAAMKAGALDYVVKSPGVFEALPQTVASALRHWRLLKDRKRAEIRLAESENRYRNLVSYSPFAVFINSGDRVVLANKACLALFGAREEGELLGKSPYELFHHDFHEKMHERIRILRERGEPVPLLEERIVRLDGKTVDVEVIAAPFSLNGGNDIHVILRDITSRKQLEKEGEKLREQLYHAQRMEDIGRLIGGVAHDFNNHLTAIIGCSQIILNKLSGDSEIRSFAEMVCSAGEKAAGITRSLLAFSRKQALEMRPVDVRIIIYNIAKLMGRLIGEDVELVLEQGEAPLFVKGDSGQIEQVLMNLATNARDAMPTGGTITISTESIHLDHEFMSVYGWGHAGDYALISFSDKGCGIPEDTRDKIFEPFFTSKEAGKGTGLGLSIVHGIIQQHGGYIRLESSPGSGTTFFIYLPLLAEKPVPEMSLAHSTIGRGNETILVCEDESSVRRLMRLVLEDNGYSVLEAVDGLDAVEVFRRHADCIDLVLLDVVMPKQSGMGAFNEIRGLRPGVRVVFTSGYTPESIDRSGVFEMKVPFIPKPVAPGLLLKIVRDTLDGK
jgi:PAS domain S-box-containing protein